MFLCMTAPIAFLYEQSLLRRFWSRKAHNLPILSPRSVSRDEFCQKCYFVWSIRRLLPSRLVKNVCVEYLYSTDLKL